MLRRSFTALVAAAVSLAGSGCSSVINHFMVDAPNRGETGEDLGLTPPVLMDFHRVDRQFRIDVGPPEASLLVWIVDPIARGLETGEPAAAASTNIVASPPRGTILILHGYRNQMQWMLGDARDLARRGFRTVLVDLRGQGSSTGDFISFGALESNDLVQVIDELERRGEIAGNLGVYGISYGASTAIMLAGRDPRIKAVVAVAPFASMRSIVPHYAHLFIPTIGTVMSDADIDALITEQSAECCFNADEADASLAAAQTNSPILLLHGEWDWLVPPDQSRQIAESASAAGRDVKRISLPATGHVTIYFDVFGRVEREAAQWFEQRLATDASSAP